MNSTVEECYFHMNTVMEICLKVPSDSFTWTNHPQLQTYSKHKQSCKQVYMINRIIKII